MEEYFKMLIFLLVFSLNNVYVGAGVDDCWDPEKLDKMKFKETGAERNDPNLSQFSKLLKCITKQQSGGDFRDWENVAHNGQLPPGWNYPNGQPQPPQWGRPGDGFPQDYGRGDGRRPPPPPYPPPQYPPPTGQPRPGVHPEDWNSARDPGNPDVRWSTSGYEDTNREDDVGTGRGNRKDRKKNRNQRKKDRVLDDNEMGQSFQPEIIDDRKGPWNDNSDNMVHHQQPPDGAMGRDYMMADDDETSLNRKYGYAIMALSVVVLAVLMVSTIFCCNSSNSTMNQPAVQALPISQVDNYSMYSYKQGHIPADTLLSSGTLADASLRTDTLHSRGSPQPQYRVSDINPDLVKS